MASLNRVRRSATEWAVIFEDYQASGISAVRYCEQAGLSIKTFSKWRRRLQGDHTRVPGFVEVTEALTEEVRSDAPNWDVELALGPGMTLRIRRQR